MNPEIKKKWVDALRSGKYRQGAGVLRSKTDEYCCLGVLCDIHAKETGAEWRDTGIYYWHYGHLTGTLPMHVCEWAGLVDGDPSVNYQDFPLRLSRVNDAKNLNFNEIATLIEKDL